MADATDPRQSQRSRRTQVREALDRLVKDSLSTDSGMVFFDYSITCEIGNGGKRQLVIRAGKKPQVHDPRGRTAALTRR